MTEEGAIIMELLKALILLHGKGEPKEKAEALYNWIQKGGVSKHPQVSANDKDFKPIFFYLCNVSVPIIFKLAQIIGDIPEKYDNDTYQQLLDIDVLDSVIDEVFLEQVYGVKSRLSYEEWVDAVCTKANWILDADGIRKIWFCQTNITYLY